MPALTRMVRATDRWFWYIPLPNDRSSIGVVCDTALYRQAKKSPEEFLEQSLAEQPFLARRMTRARRVTPAYASADFSYRQSPPHGRSLDARRRRRRIHRSGF